MQYFPRLYEEGHEVVGVKLREIAVRSYFSKHFRNYFIEKPIKDVDCNLFSTLDGSLRIYQMNFFKLVPYATILIIFIVFLFYHEYNYTSKEVSSKFKYRTNKSVHLYS